MTHNLTILDAKYIRKFAIKETENGEIIYKLDVFYRVRNAEIKENELYGKIEGNHVFVELKIKSEKVREILFY